MLENEKNKHLLKKPLNFFSPPRKNEFNISYAKLLRIIKIFQSFIIVHNRFLIPVIYVYQNTLRK
jgi:hypothetical protein